MENNITEKPISAKRKIINAYLDLLKENPYNKISVAQVVYNADVNRSTFYRNFVDIFDLYDKIVDDFVEELIEAFVAHSPKYGDYRRFDSSTCSSEKLEKYKETVLLLTGVNGTSRLFDKFLQKYIFMLDEASKKAGHFDEETEFMHLYLH